MMNSGSHIRTVYLFYTQDLEVWKVVAGAGMTLLAMLVNIIPPLLALGVLILIDTRFGIKKYIKRKNKENKKILSRENFRSWGIRKMLSKSADYMFIIVASLFMETFVLEHLGINFKHNNLTLTTFTVLAMCLVEIKSINENFYAVNGVSLWRYVLLYFFNKKPVTEILEELNDNEKSNEENKIEG